MNHSKQRTGGATKRLSATAQFGHGGSDPWPSTPWKSTFRRRLLIWFRKHGRRLPWRGTSDPYAIWVSEIMLQQTQVATVVPYYERFLARLPTVEALAAADEHDVLRLWEGLGYYRRTRQMHTAAKRIVSDHGGQVPRDAEALRRLPGIGRYTAGAILSLAFDARQPILEANTLRLFARLLAFRGEPLSGAGQKLLWSAAEALLPRRGSGIVNQALMELGSRICTPRAPRCDCCPVAALCSTNLAGLQDLVPRPKSKPRVEHVHEAAVVVRDGDRVLLVQRAAGERWAGLWDFPRFAVDADGRENSLKTVRQLRANVARSCRLHVELGEKLTTICHGVTRFRITLNVFGARPRASGAGQGGGKAHDILNTGDGDSQPRFAQQRWVLIEELSQYPLSTTGRRIAQLVESR